jgi:dTMP kinase
MGGLPYDHIVKQILPAIEAGYTVICDIFIDSTAVYQGLEIDGGIEYIACIKSSCPL